ncbi:MULTISPECIES: GAF domain-containing protein [unclassified Mesorhizobium]|uniref:GAF domain-containing protein n=1 Tax=unclassified Mesorhizobium TaxID=325217 RepID=UPI0003D0427A|nr:MULTISPECIES: GAF domain-containing protein [unclassified Mesorhizobium]ESZ19638.1 histidine kinase [Mesorhizobium sp. L48C026A00]
MKELGVPGSLIELEQKVALLTQELDETREQQAAAADVLRVISRSAFDLDAVLTALTQTAIRLCEASRGVIWLSRNGQLFLAAHVNYPDEWVAYVRANPITPAADAVTTSGRAAFAGEVFNIEDVQSDSRCSSLAGHKLADYGAALAVPLKRDGEVVGVISLSRTEARLFSDRQIAVVQTFADQAVIAMENVRLVTSLDARNREAAEAFRQQTATADVLRVISRSAFDLQTVLDTLTESAARLCQADMSGICRSEGPGFYYASSFGFPPDWLVYNKDRRLDTGRGSIVGRVLLDGALVQVADVLADPDYTYFEPQAKAGYRTLLGVPLMREGKAIGVLVLARRTVAPFTDKQIELLGTFADQAVIAIENVRLFEEVEARTRDLGEALEQQTATSEVLGVIAASPTDIQPVLKTVVENAARLCAAYDAAVLLKEQDSLVIAAHFGPIPIDFTKFPLRRDWVAGRSVVDARTIQVPDLMSAGDEFAAGRAMAERLGHRTILGTPLLRDGEAIGTILLRRTEVAPFTAKQVNLVETFADQAVIAIQNVRLFEEVQARNRALTASLEQQTATNDILSVISSSPTDVQPVFDMIAEASARLCEAEFSAVFRYDGALIHFVAQHGLSPAGYQAMSGAYPLSPGRSGATARAVLSGNVEQIPDVYEDPDYALGDVVTAVTARSIAAVPMLKNGQAIGAIAVAGSEPGLFPAQQIALLQTFADQAVIAVENVRLFDEVQARTAELGETLRQQTAIADVLKVISRSTFDLQAVLGALAATATRVCEADMGSIMRRDGETYQFAANAGFPQELVDYAKENPLTIGQGSATSRAVLDRHTVHLPDVLADPSYTLTDFQSLGGYRSLLAVPLVREGSAVGVFILTRSTVRPFTEKQIELVETFADQAVIAIENVRLFEEVQKRTSELSSSLEELRAAQDRLIQTEKLASLGQLTAGIAHEIKNPLNFVNNFSAVSLELVEELRQALDSAPLDGPIRKEVDELTGLLKGDLEKIVQHGRRADSIVKNMLLHSRQGSGEHRPTSINAIVEESLNLAYHGARAERRDFNITVEKSLDPDAGDVDLYPQEITRVLLNLISNSFHATTHRGQGDGNAYSPVLCASTKSLGDKVEIRLRDNGTGIPPEVVEKMFNPFFTTKPAGEGTGLGLSLSHDIIVKQHAGTLEVDTKPGEFTEFRILLPRGAASVGKKAAAQ